MTKWKLFTKKNSCGRGHIQQATEQSATINAKTLACRFAVVEYEEEEEEVCVTDDIDRTTRCEKCTENWIIIKIDASCLSASTVSLPPFHTHDFRRDHYMHTRTHIDSVAGRSLLCLY